MSNNNHALLALGAIGALTAASQLSKRRRSGSPALSLEQILAAAEQAKKAAPRKARTRTSRRNDAGGARAGDGHLLPAPGKTTPRQFVAIKKRIVKLVRAGRLDEARELFRSWVWGDDRMGREDHTADSSLLLTNANLSGVNLSGVDLSGSNMSDADLRMANLSKAKLRSVWLDSANLSGADLTGANLTEAHLSRADLSGANLAGANLTGAWLSGANLTGANLTGAKLEGVSLSESELDASRDAPSWRSVDEAVGIDLGPNRVFKGVPRGYQLQRSRLSGRTTLVETT